MLTADDIADLRKGGASDADILSTYKQFNPQSASDIDDLTKDGADPKSVLEALSQYGQGQKAPKGEDRPWYSNLGRALQFGAANTVAGVGATARRAGYTGVADTLKRTADAAAPSNYETQGDKFQALSPSTWGSLPYAVAEGAPGMATDLAAGLAGGLAGPAGAVTGFMAMNAARNFGQNVDARVGGADKAATTKDMLISGGATAAEGALNRIGLGPAIGTVAKGVGGQAVKSAVAQVGKAGAAEAAAGAAGDVVNQVGRTADTEGGLRIDPNEVLNNSVMSGAMGAAVRGARLPGDVNNAIRNRDVNMEAASRLVERMDGLKVDTSSPEGAYKAVTTTRTALDSNINEQAKIVSPFLKSKGNDTNLDETRALLNETKSLLKSNKTVSEDQLTALSERLDGFEEGQKLVGLLQERQELNRLADRGRFEQSPDKPNGYFAGGITSNKTAQAFLDPIAALRSRLGPSLAVGGASGIAGLTAAGKLAVAAPYAAQILGGQMALNGAAHVTDRVLGNRNPAGEFMNRFRGLDQGDGLTAPSSRAAAALKKLNGEIEGSERAADTIASREDARKASQTDKAWSQKAKADEAAQREADRRDAEMDRAYASQEVDPNTVQAQQEAMWQAKEKQDALSQAEDTTAQEGIFAGNSDKLAQAVQAGLASKKARESADALRKKQTDKAIAEKGSQDAQEARKAQEVERAYEQANGRPGPSEADLWATHEKAQAAKAAGEPSDLEAQAGIEQGYRFLAQQALQAQQAREGQTSKAYAERDRQNQAVDKEAAQRNRDFNKAETERRRPDPQRVKAAQEEAMWKAQEEGTLPQDWSDADAIAAIKREETGRAKESQSAIAKALKDKADKEKAAKTGKGIKDVGDTLDFPGDPEPLKVKVRAKAKSQADEVKTAEVNPETISVRHGDQTVERPKEGIRNVNAYVAKTRTRMATRQKFADKILSEAGKRQKPYLDAMLGKLNNSAKSWDEALDVIHDTITDLPFNQQSHAWDMYNLHEGDLKATYDR